MPNGFSRRTRRGTTRVFETARVVHVRRNPAGRVRAVVTRRGAPGPSGRRRPSFQPSGRVQDGSAETTRNRARAATTNYHDRGVVQSDDDHRGRSRVFRENVTSVRDEDGPRRPVRRAWNTDRTTTSEVPRRPFFLLSDRSAGASRFSQTPDLCRIRADLPNVLFFSADADGYTLVHWVCCEVKRF